MVEGKPLLATCPKCKDDKCPVSKNPDTGNIRIYCYTCCKYRIIGKGAK